MKKILVCCGNGVGSSLMMKMGVADIFDKYQVPVHIDHASLGEAESIGRNYDIVLCPLVFEGKLAHLPESVEVIGVKNVLSEKEIETKLKEHHII